MARRQPQDARRRPRPHVRRELSGVRRRKLFSAPFPRRCGRSWRSRTKPLSAAAAPADDDDEETFEDVVEVAGEDGSDRTRRDQSRLLDRLFSEGLLPRYAFPTDVAGFSVFEERTAPWRPKLRYSPQQALNQALSEYAAGAQGLGGRQGAPVARPLVARGQGLARRLGGAQALPALPRLRLRRTQGPPRRAARRKPSLARPAARRARSDPRSTGSGRRASPSRTTCAPNRPISTLRRGFAPRRAKLDGFSFRDASPLGTCGARQRGLVAGLERPPRAGDHQPRLDQQPPTRLLLLQHLRSRRAGGMG